MTKKRYTFILKIFLFFIVFLSPPYLRAEKNNSSPTTQYLSNRGFEKNLDSLSKLTYVSRCIKNTSVNLQEIPEFDDILYKERIQALSTTIPLEFNAEVKKFIRFYTIQKREKVAVMLGLTNYYFPFFEKALQKYHLPAELKYLPLAESALFPRSVSDTGGSGLWQIMYTIGIRYGLEINQYVDERKDPVKASDAAARHLNDLYNLYEDWLLAIAAYNCGPGNVNKAIAKAGCKTGIWDIYEFLPKKNREYIAAFIALNYVMHNYKSHNITPITIIFPTKTDTISIDEKVHLEQIAEVLHLNIKELRELNPVYRSDIVDASKKNKESLIIPKEFVTAFEQSQEKIFSYNDSVYFKPKPARHTYQFTPAKVYTSTYTSSYKAPSIKGKAKIYYTIKSGDTMGEIANWFNVRVSDLRYWNGIPGNRIIAGDKLLIYVPKNKESFYARLNTMSKSQKQQRNKKYTVSNTLSKSHSLPRPTVQSQNDGRFVYYTVRSGDNLWEIAKRFPGISHEDIMKLNNLPYNHTLRIGQVLKIKRK